MDGLTLFLLLVLPIMFGVYCFVCLLNFRHNFIWRRYQLNLLEVGEYRWHMGSPKWGKGHRVVVVKAIDRKKRKIIYDEWGRSEIGWEQLQEGVETSVADFFHFTNGEPIKWVGSLEDLSEE